ncbi:MAG TPA: deoxyribonuclease IV [Phycisphaerales bacterium]|nr:deoxyribonuclease IV [Phycisphaerales bacterium]
MFGSHLSIAGTMVNALLRAEALRFDTVQVFTKNQRQWKVHPLDPGMQRDWLAHMKRLKWEGRVVSHASYLINLASPGDEIWRKSIDLMTVELERAEVLGIPFVVHHPGAYTSTTLEQGLHRIATAYKELFQRTKGLKTIACLEGTTGSGTNIGGRFEHLAALRQLIIDMTGEPQRVGFCLDTCHLHAAGYDMSTAAAATQSLKLFDQMCGIENLHVMHLNDSKGALGSKLDRHQHIGEGAVGGLALKPTLETLSSSGFPAVINHPRISKLPKILETPKEDECPPGPPEPGSPKQLDSINLERLRAIFTAGGKPGPFPPESTAPAKPTAKPVKKPAAAPAKPAATAPPATKPTAAKPSAAPAPSSSAARKKITKRTSTKQPPPKRPAKPPI